MGGERIVFSRPAAELSCIVGSLYESLEPPCGVSGGPDDIITLFGQTHTGNTLFCGYCLTAVSTQAHPRRWRLC